MKKVLFLLLLCSLPVSMPYGKDEPKPKKYCRLACKCTTTWEDWDFLNDEPITEHEEQSYEYSYRLEDEEYTIASCNAFCEGWDSVSMSMVKDDCHNVPEPEPEPEPEPDPEEPEPDPDPTPTGTACASVPLLENFTTTQNTCSANELNFTFAPKGSQLFYMHVNLKFENGRDVLSAWCTGDEKICKAIGNGKACNGTDYTGANAWCYKAAQ